jgi:Sec-independent protein translocase protein TatA
MQTKHISYSSSRRPSLLRKAVTLVGMVALAAVALMFSAVLLVVILIVVVFGGAFLWWKTRAVRRQFREMQARMRQMQEAAAVAGESQTFRGEVYEGEIIEGVAVRVSEIEVRRDR